jgi:hypothetical protein
MDDSLEWSRVRRAVRESLIRGQHAPKTVSEEESSQDDDPDAHPQGDIASLCGVARQRDGAIGDSYADRNAPQDHL